MYHDIIVGRDSLFDSNAYLKCSPPDLLNVPDGFSAAWQTNMKIGVRIPRLMRLVRRARRYPEDATIRAEATTLASNLFEFNLDFWIANLIDSGMIKQTESSKL